MVSVDAVPVGASRPSWVTGRTPGNPPFTWWPSTGEFQTHWDWQLADALSVPGVWRARMLISQAIGQMPLGDWRGNTRVEPLTQILRQPNPYEDRMSTVAAWVCDLLDHGNAFGIVRREAEAIEPVPAARVSTDGRIYEVTGEDGTKTRYGYSDVFHAKGAHSPGAPRGMGVLEAGLSSVNRMIAEGQYASRAFTSGLPSGLLKIKDPDLDEGSPDDEANFFTAQGIKKSWQAQVEAGGIAAMSELVDFVPLSWTPTDAQMVEARQMSLVDVANMFNIDPYWVGGSQASAPYQNVQQSALQLSRFTLGFWISSLEAQFSRLVPRGREARFDREVILAEEPSTRVDNAVKLLQAGVLTTDEVRARFDLPPLDRGEASNVIPFPQSDATTNEAVS